MEGLPFSDWGRGMAVTIEALIERLSVAERLELIDQIWDSLPVQVAPEDVPAWHLAELAKRRAELEADNEPGIPWQDVLRDLGKGT